MSLIVVISIEGVLAQDPDLRMAAPTRWARPLYESLRTQYRTIGLTSAEPTLAKWWVEREGLTDWAGVLSRVEGWDYAKWKVEQVRDFLAEGWEVGMMIDVDGDVLAEVNEMGVLTMLMSYPANRVGWRSPDAGPRSWSQVIG